MFKYITPCMYSSICISDVLKGRMKIKAIIKLRKLKDQK